MTFTLSPTKAWTRRAASALSSGAPTVPVSSTTPFSVLTRTLASGMASISIWSTESMFDPTRTVAE